MMVLVNGHGGEVGCSFLSPVKAIFIIVVMETLVIVTARALAKVLDKVMNMGWFT